MQGLAQDIEAVLRATPVADMHTHLYSPAFGHSGRGGVKPNARPFLLWGLDELLTYHYLIAEVFRVVPATQLAYEDFWRMPKPAQAEHVWRHLFVERTPLSEACRGVLTTLAKLGLDPNERDLAALRDWFDNQDADAHIDRVMDLAGVESITMTNEVFDAEERALWLRDPGALRDPRFRPVLRVDPLIRDWPTAAFTLSGLGYDVEESLSPKTAHEARRFLREWLERTDAVYVATSLPPTFRYPDPSDPTATAIIDKILLPTLIDAGKPWAMMIGSRLGVNHGLREGGDALGKADVESLTNLCHAFPGARFFVTMLSRENQHELCVAARKFGNLMPFGCWWFLNNPSIIREITRQRLELLGTSFIPQHSDARVLDQLIYKWDHSRTLIAECLAESYQHLANAGYTITPQVIEADADRLLRRNFHEFLPSASQTLAAAGPAA